MIYESNVLSLGMDKEERIKLFTDSVSNIALSLDIKEDIVLYLLLDMCNTKYNYLIKNELEKYEEL